MNDNLLSFMGGLPEGLLGAEQQAQAEQRARQAAALQLGLGMIAGSQGQRGAGRPGLAQIVAQAGPGAIQAYQGSFDQTLKNMLLQQQMADAQRKRAQEQAQQQALQSFVETLPEDQRARFMAFPTQAAEAMFREPGETFRPLSSQEAAQLGLPPNVSFQISSKGKISQVGQTPAAVVNVGGQKDFKNELDLKTEFRSEPIYKAHQEMNSAYSQITESIKKSSPAGDLAAATKFMKLLDPGSVVRESELMMAMQASGAFDRFVNYANNIITGQKLTPTQRQDFQSLADKLFDASAGAYNIKLNEYKDIGSAYGINAERALGKPSKTSTQFKTPTTNLIDQVREEMARRGMK